MLGFVQLRRSILSTAVFSSVFLAACSTNNDDSDKRLSSPSTVRGATFAVVGTTSSDYSSRALSIVQTAAPYGAENELLPTDKDADISGHGGYLYVYERYQHDNIAKFDAKTLAANSTPLWQFSVLDKDETGSANIHDMVFVSDTKAYLIRYGKAKAWIVNPSATKEAEFKTGELDLTAFADADGIPEMEAGVVVGNKLFIIVQRLDQSNGWEPGDAYVVVYDTTTDKLINTATNTENGGIRINIANPGSIAFNENTQKIYIAGIGSYSNADKASGVVEIDPTTYVTRTVMDSKNQVATATTFKKVSALEIIDGHNAYFVDYVGWGNNVLHKLDTTSGVIAAEAVADLKGININSITSDGSGHLWVGDSTKHQLVVIDIKDDTVIEKIDTSLNPGRVVFFKN